ncbi:MAG: efflux RND transporter periplasmic adaptor subunit [candidate division KSB1 bacterium]|nr:efflux RND transporter periplasmic adaptor subunit [candidate division KSB1 bacterium]MDZ7368551.1 efflux RND transporter periplasmic adaptor subunit [candidate division KSB1 bacterium]MDZ7406411.1 efflux RND transporter periplasmic adaptor subunit [candidate division KSB1 bacterium]
MSATVCAFLMLAAFGCSQQQAQGGFSMPPMPVETATVTPSVVIDPFEAVGTIEAEDAITVVSEIDATVIDLPFKEGAAIAKGGLIAQLDDIQLRAEEERAKAILEQRQVTYERIKTITDEGLGTAQSLDDAAAALKVAEADLALIRARLRKTRIVAPFAGIVGARKVSPGAFVRAGSPITELAQVNRLRINFSAPERYYSSLQRGAEVKVSTTAYPGYELTGKVDIIEPVVDPATRRTKIVARIDNPGGKFRPGMSANVTVVLSERENALVIPSEAVFVEGNQALVFVIQADSTVVRTPVELGTRLRDKVEVLNGVAAGTMVVRAGHQKLFPGAKVMPIAAAPQQKQ